MRIVRTVGQAFEVCHKKSVVEKNHDDRSGTPSSIQDRCSEPLSDDEEDDIDDTKKGKSKFIKSRHFFGL